MQILEGALTAPAGPFILIAARFNDLIVERLVNGARDALKRAGVSDAQLRLIRVPGAWELPLVADAAISKFKPLAVIALGCVIRGDTHHFDIVANDSASGLAQVSRQRGVPVLNAVLTTDTLEQALDRAGGKAGNKGADAAIAAIEMAQLMTQLKP
jgi:6,7-dimethyl-8-ribityllumazine synthase